MQVEALVPQPAYGYRHIPSRRMRFSPVKLLDGLYGEVNSVKNHNYKLWLNYGVY